MIEEVIALDVELNVLNDDDCSDVLLQGDELSEVTANREENEDQCAGEGEPRFEDSLRPSCDGLVRVHRQTVMVVFRHPGQPAIEQRMRCIWWDGRR